MNTKHTEKEEYTLAKAIRFVCTILQKLVRILMKVINSDRMDKEQVRGSVLRICFILETILLLSQLVDQRSNRFTPSKLLLPEFGPLIVDSTGMSQNILVSQP
ncbi:hypothetical protein PsorP6_007956 [Peronosclerospora sorghi]|uniref:Uncharacterized protein n=1 Tax=Peronosclerospora sorghi TaxID=230839 RepID=A0ACC0WBG9_9STRA|nr:hypothetical protein PsorP6_007956 [Peronosclerospora sorghi]